MVACFAVAILCGIKSGGHSDRIDQLAQVLTLTCFNEAFIRFIERVERDDGFFKGG